MKLAIYCCHQGARQTTQKLVNFYMLITLKQFRSSLEIVKKSLW